MILVACMLQNMTHCQEIKIHDSRQLSMMECLVASQPTAARWRNDHPKWWIVQIRCQPWGREKA